MDGLSVAANILAVIGAARLAAQGLQKLYSLRKAPDQVLLLLGEVSELQTMLSIVQETLDQLLICDQFQDQMINGHLARTVQNAFDTLNELNGVVESGLIKNFDQMSNERVKISWNIWLRKHSYLNLIFTRLRDIKLSIASALTLLTSSEVPRLRANLHRILLDNRSMIHNLQSLEREIAPLSPNIKKLQGALDNLQPKPSTQSSEVQAASHPQYLWNQNIPQTGCNELCICRCHEQKSFQSPLWAATIFGQLFLAYSGTTLSQNHNCNIISCQEWRSKQVVFRATYFFPSWFLRRVLVICDRWSPMEHSISVRTPRLIPDDPRFFAAQMGKTQSLQKLFTDGTGSPFDTRARDKLPLLVFAVTYKRVETCRFLLQNHADPEQEDEKSRSSLDRLTMYLIVDPLNPIHIELKQIFSPYLDMNETIGKRRFSNLHKIVLNLTSSPIDLEAYLQLSVSEIESVCSLGRTPLLWAATSSNTHAIKLLLKYGAKIDSVDDQGHNVFHQTGSLDSGDVTEALTLLLEAAASHSNELLMKMVNQPNNDHTRPLDYTCLNNKPKQLMLLLTYKATPEPASTSPKSIASIFYAIDNNNHEVIELLLEAGAKTDIKDNLQKSILHIVAEDADLKTIRILSTRAQPPMAIETRDTDIFGLTPMELFEKHCDDIASWDEVYKAKRRKAFVDLELSCAENFHHSAKDVAGSKDIVVQDSLLHTEEDASELPDTKSDFSSNHSENSDEEVFFDASSDPEIDIYAETGFSPSLGLESNLKSNLRNDVKNNISSSLQDILG